MVSKGEGMGKRRIGSLGFADANLHIEWVNNKVLLCSTKNYIQYPVINHNGKECIYICILFDHFVIQQKLIQHNSTILEYNFFFLM